jgi:dihydrofolate reductase
MRLTVTTFVTLDGVYQAPGRPDEDDESGFRHGGWSFPYADADFGAAMVGWFTKADAFLLGRKTYDIFASHWPKVTDEADPIASRLNTLPKYVVSRSQRPLGWARRCAWSTARRPARASRSLSTSPRVLPSTVRSPPRSSPREPVVNRRRR